MKQKLLYFFSVISLVISLSGCSTSSGVREANIREGTRMVSTPPAKLLPLIREMSERFGDRAKKEMQTSAYQLLLEDTTIRSNPRFLQALIWCSQNPEFTWKMYQYYLCDDPIWPFAVASCIDCFDKQQIDRYAWCCFTSEESYTWNNSIPLYYAYANKYGLKCLAELLRSIPSDQFNYPCMLTSTYSIARLQKDEIRKQYARLINGDSCDWSNTFLLDDALIHKAYREMEQRGVSMQNIQLLLFKRGDVSHLSDSEYLLDVRGNRKTIVGVPGILESLFPYPRKDKCFGSSKQKVLFEISARLKKRNLCNLTGLPLSLCQDIDPSIRAWNLQDYSKIMKAIEVLNEKGVNICNSGKWLDFDYPADIRSIEFKEFWKPKGLEITQKDIVDALNLCMVCDDPRKDFHQSLTILASKGLFPVDWLNIEYFKPARNSYISWKAYAQNIGAFWLVFRDDLEWNLETKSFQWK